MDIIAQEIQTNGGLKEILPASGGNWGGTTVDDEFQALLQSIHGLNFEDLKTSEAYDYFDLLREFEVKKRSPDVLTGANSPVVLRVPMSVTTLTQAEYNTAIDCKTLNYQYFDKDKIRLEHVSVRLFFQTLKEKIVSHVKELLAKDELSNISTIVFVGGYAESKLLQDFVRTSFDSKEVIVPNQSDLAVLKGAVIFGHDPSQKGFVSLHMA